MGFGGICVFYLKCRSQGKLSSWNSCGQTQMSGTSHGHKSRFSWIRLDGWRCLDIQNYRKMPGEVYKSVQAGTTQLPFSAWASECFGILVSLSKCPSTCKFLWKSVLGLWLHTSWLSVCFSVPRKWICGFWKESAGVTSYPFQRTKLQVKALQLLEHICCLHPSIISFLS